MNIISILKAIFINWFTSLAGSVAGVSQIIDGFADTPDDWAQIILGIALIIAGLLAKDLNVSGGTVKQ